MILTPHRSYKKAFIVGKFYPPHIGHENMIEFALDMCDEVVVCVEKQINEKIDVKTRQGWIREAFDNNNRLCVKSINIQPQSEDEFKNKNEFWKHWGEIILKNAPSVDVIISGDDYGKRLASEVGVDWIKVDRSITKMSATAWRENPWGEFLNLSLPSRLYMQKSILFIGPESTGKSFAVKKIGDDKKLHVVDEFAEKWIKQNPDRKIDEKALEIFLHGQKALEKSVGKLAGPVLIKDSNALSTGIWAKYFGYGKIAEKCFAEAEKQNHDLIFLFDYKNTPWKIDGHRVNENSRVFFYEEVKKWLDDRGIKYILIDGEIDKRLDKVMDVMQNKINEWKGDKWDKWVDKNKYTVKKVNKIKNML